VTVSSEFGIFASQRLRPEAEPLAGVYHLQIRQGGPDGRICCPATSAKRGLTGNPKTRIKARSIPARASTSAV